MAVSTSTGSEDDLDRESRSGKGFFKRMSGTLVSVELLTETGMRSSRPRSSRQTTRRVILKASITSVIILSIAFIITYSVILTYISNRVPLMRHQESSAEKSKSGKRAKFIARPIVSVNKGNILKFVKSDTVKWDVKDYEDVTSDKPKCAKESKVVILVTSAPQNVERRKSIRETWCRAANFNLVVAPWQCVFLVGHSAEHLSSVQKESVEQSDILIGSYVDSYRNLTIKIMHGLDWVSEACQTNYVLKTDDDVFVNTEILTHLLANSTEKENVYIGLVVHTESRLRVIRSPESKWYVSYDQYPHSHYSPYAVGMGYLLSIDVVHKLLTASGQIPPFANEDAYIGVLANEVDVLPFRSGRFTLTSYGLRTCNFRYLVIVHHVQAEEQYKLFEMTQESARTCRDDGSIDSTWL